MIKSAAENRPKHTLDTLAANSSHFSVPLTMLRGERESAIYEMEIKPAAMLAVLEQQRRVAALSLISYIDALADFGNIGADNADGLRQQVMILRDRKSIDLAS